MTPSEIGQFTSRLCTWWPQTKFTPGVTNMHFLGLFEEEQATLEEAFRALSFLRNSGKDFYPSPTAADISAALTEVRKHKLGHRELTIEERWAKLLQAASKSIPWEQLTKRLSERTKTTIQAIGGWDRIRYCDSEEIHFVRKDFISTYESITVRDDKFNALETAAAPQLEFLMKRLIGEKQP